MPSRASRRGQIIGPKTDAPSIRCAGIGKGNGHADGRALDGHAAIGQILVGMDAVCGHIRETGQERGNARTVRH